MDLLIPSAQAVVGLVLVLIFAERLVRGVAGLAAGLGLSAFLLSVVFLGFDPENLAVGAAGAYEGASGLALGSIVGAAMVALALAFGITALIVPMRFERAPLAVLGVPVAAVLLLAALAWDGELTRSDGLVLLAGYAVTIGYLWWLSRHGIDIEADSEVAAEAEEAREAGAGRSAVLLLVSLAGVAVGGELLVLGSSDLIGRLGLSETVVGMTILALAVSIEELARELPAALKGRAEISYGNVAGSAVGFFLLNAGLIALLAPLEVDGPTRTFYLPFAIGTVVLVSALLWTRRVGRPAGAILVLLYAVFAVGGYVLFGAPATT
ncbi:MAG: sodium:calcium antiporter [Chloroflexi bacterium]|nr:sodium:calcium antiporter [Chloroflexota bacterium]